VVNLALSFSLNSLVDGGADILKLMNDDALGDIVGSFVGGQLEQIKAKIDRILRNCGDYAYATGVGWRLALPYIRSAGGRVLVRTPSGSFHRVNDMSLAGESYQLNTRTLVLENHEAEDFTVVVRQILVPVPVVSLGSDGLEVRCPCHPGP
jgi:hypothetical protein